MPHNIGWSLYNAVFLAVTPLAAGPERRTGHEGKDAHRADSLEESKRRVITMIYAPLF